MFRFGQRQAEFFSRGFVNSNQQRSDSLSQPARSPSFARWPKLHFAIGSSACSCKLSRACPQNESPPFNSAFDSNAPSAIRSRTLPLSLCGSVMKALRPTHIYVEADLDTKEKALQKTIPDGRRFQSGFKPTIQY